jgi:NADH:ubiquinone oxidoreductase subunit H
MRGILQSLSYEVTIIIIFVLVLFLGNSLNFVNLGFSQLEIMLS